MTSNSTLKIHDKEFSLFIESEKLHLAVARLAQMINADYNGKNPLFVSVLNGSFMFTSDLLKLVNIPCELSFVKVASYCGLSSTGSISELIGLNIPVNNRHVILLEDIVDTGNTVEYLINNLQKMAPASIEVASMFYKPDAYKKMFKIKYIGLEISNDFIVGYGLDYNEGGRNLPEVYKIV